MSLPTYDSDFKIDGLVMTPLSTVALARRLALLFIQAAMLCWLLAGLLTLAKLAWLVPLSDLDYAAMSWLGSPRSALRFTTGPVGVLMMSAVFVFGLIISSIDGTWRAASIAALASLVLGFGMGQGAVARIGMYEDVIKIGCFVPESMECRKMLHLPRNGADSMYLTEAQSVKWSNHQDWYRQARSKAVSAGQEQLAGLLSVPGAVLFRAPLYWDKAEELAEKVTMQRMLLQQQMQLQAQQSRRYVPGEVKSSHEKSR